MTQSYDQTIVAKVQFDEKMLYKVIPYSACAALASGAIVGLGVYHYADSVLMASIASVTAMVITGKLSFDYGYNYYHDQYLSNVSSLSFLGEIDVAIKVLDDIF